MPDEQVVRHLEDAGVNYVVTRSDTVRLRNARVSARVIDSLLKASDRFAARASYQPDDDGWYYGDPWAPYFYGDWQRVPENVVYDNGFKEQWEMFIRHVCEDAPYKYTLLEGAKGVQLAECALQSWRERRWVDVAPFGV